jgi:hypothetical protein
MFKMIPQRKQVIILTITIDGSSHEMARYRPSPLKHKLRISEL